jgi:transposase
MVMMPVSLEKQRRPGTLEFAINLLVQRCIDPSIFDGRYTNAAASCPADAPQVLLKIVLFAYSRGIVSSRKIEHACRETITFMALSCGMVPDHSTIAALVSSMQEALLSLFRDVLLVCEEQGLLGGTHFALDGLKLSSNAAKEWSGTFDDLRQQKAKLEAKVQSLLAAHARADREGATARIAESCDEPDKRQEQMERIEKQAACVENF